jgi:hypothetical protein
LATWKQRPWPTVCDCAGGPFTLRATMSSSPGACRELWLLALGEQT